MKEFIVKNKVICAVIAVVIVLCIIVGAISCNSRKNNTEAPADLADVTVESNEASTLGDTTLEDGLSSETVSEEIPMGDNEVPFGDVEELTEAVTEHSDTVTDTSANNTEATKAENVTSAQTQAANESLGDNVVDFIDEDETVSDVPVQTEQESDSTAPSIEVDEDGWSTIIVKP